MTLTHFDTGRKEMLYHSVDSLESPFRENYLEGHFFRSQFFKK